MTSRISIQREQILIEILSDIAPFSSNRVRLILFLGCFGDFDSIEYCQLLKKQLSKINSTNLEIIVIGIGNNSSKLRFSKYTGIPPEYIYVQLDSTLHKKLQLSTGIDTGLGNCVNFLLMCMGVNSASTLFEVLRGYTGDRSAKPTFTNNEIISIGQFKFDISELFNKFKKPEFQRPFELATLRLINMIEILSNWSIYFPFNEYITQRGATFILDEDDKLVYHHCPDGLLSFSPDMSRPLDFLNPYLEV